jgi:hypothetical protein
MTDQEKAKIKRLVKIEKNLSNLLPKIRELSWEFNYLKNKKLIEDIYYIHGQVQNAWSDIGSIRADLWLEWNKEEIK